MVEDRILTTAWASLIRELLARLPTEKNRSGFPLPLIAAVLLLLSLLPTVPDVAGKTQGLSNVVIISIDALHPDALHLAKIPNIRKLMSAGAYTLDGRSTEPPKTLIAHTAMFTGLPPEKSGKMDNDWAPGETTVDRETIFDSALRYGFTTGYFYSKEKLGYLVSRAVDVHEWSRDNAVDSAEAFVKTSGRHFLFIHMSGLDQVGPQSGWLSPDYLEELSFIDEYLSSLVGLVIGKQNYLLIVTSDHAGHGKVHGSDHPDDKRLPLIVSSDVMAVERFQGTPFSLIELKEILEAFMKQAS